MKQAAEQERVKIYRDLHDDVGSRLLSIIHADTDNKLGSMARTALESLRRAVSKANTRDQALSELLAGIREETELRLTSTAS
jgi:signal transduction histidine kinase